MELLNLLHKQAAAGHITTGWMRDVRSCPTRSVTRARARAHTAAYLISGRLKTNDSAPLTVTATPEEEAFSFFNLTLFKS